jgi:DNA-binding CsgD family transcriptional regulator
MNHEMPIKRRSRMAFVAIIDSDDAATLARLQAFLPNHALVQTPLPVEIDKPVGVGRAMIRDFPKLTTRQQAILPLLLQNRSNKEIGRILSISHFTVRSHVSQLLRALEVPSRKVAIALMQGYPVDLAAVDAPVGMVEMCSRS